MKTAPQPGRFATYRPACMRGFVPDLPLQFFASPRIRVAASWPSMPVISPARVRSSLGRIVASSPERLFDALRHRSAPREPVEQVLGLACRKWRRRRCRHVRWTNHSGGLAMPENENALTTMLGKVDELGQVGFGVGQGRFPHMTNMTNLLRCVRSAHHRMRVDRPLTRDRFSFWLRANWVRSQEKGIDGGGAGNRTRQEIPRKSWSFTPLTPSASSSRRSHHVPMIASGCEWVRRCLGTSREQLRRRFARTADVSPLSSSR